MNKFIILLRPSPYMLKNLFLNAEIYLIDPACLAIALATAGRCGSVAKNSSNVIRLICAICVQKTFPLL